MSNSSVSNSEQSQSDGNASLTARLRLSMVAGVGPRISQSLLERFGTAQQVLQAVAFELRQVQGVGNKLCRNIIAAETEIDVEEELEICRQHNIDILSSDNDSYPQLLKEIPDPPQVLFSRGELLPQDSLAIAIVGSRHATRYGIKQAEHLAGGLARAGYTIVSGLARGIDAAAHKAAMRAGGRTIAIMAGGLLKVYPPEHQELADQIIHSGALLSEAPPRREPLSGAFPQRNRIVTGISLGVLVVEASQRSGALISARHAMEQNREVFAVPGCIDNRMAHGCHRLIRDGAKLVESVDDVLEELGPLFQPTENQQGQEIRHPGELQLNQQERQVLDAITSDPISLDDVAHQSQLPVHRVLSTVSVLEMRRLVRRISGNQVARV